MFPYINIYIANEIFYLVLYCLFISYYMQIHAKTCMWGQTSVSDETAELWGCQNSISRFWLASKIQNSRNRFKQHVQSSKTDTGYNTRNFSAYVTCSWPRSNTSTAFILDCCMVMQYLKYCLLILTVTSRLSVCTMF